MRLFNDKKLSFVVLIYFQDNTLNGIWLAERHCSMKSILIYGKLLGTPGVP